MSPFMRYPFLPQGKQEEHLFIFMLSSIFPSKVLASDKLKKYGMGGLVGALGTSLLTFYFILGTALQKIMNITILNISRHLPWRATYGEPRGRVRRT